MTTSTAERPRLVDLHPSTAGVPVKIVAEFTGYPLPSVYELIHKGELEAYRNGRAIRVVPASVDDFLTRHRVGTAVA